MMIARDAVGNPDMCRLGWLWSSRNGGDLPVDRNGTVGWLVDSHGEFPWEDVMLVLSGMPIIYIVKVYIFT